jgi:hypothetical protein
MGDRHVYGAKSRFLTRAVMQCLEGVTYGEALEPAASLEGKAAVDVAARLRGLWS